MQLHFFILICLFLILTVVILSLSTPTGLPEYISNSFTSLKAGDGFPVQPEGGKILYSNIAKNNVFSLTDTNFIGFNENGKEILTIQHGYDNPSSVVSKERSLVYNYKNKKYFILPKELSHYKPNSSWDRAYEYLALCLYPYIVI